MKLLLICISVGGFRRRHRETDRMGGEREGQSQRETEIESEIERDRDREMGRKTSKQGRKGYGDRK